MDYAGRGNENRHSNTYTGNWNLVHPVVLFACQSRTKKKKLWPLNEISTIKLRALTGVMVWFAYARVPKCGSKQHSSCTHQTTVCIRVTASAGLTASYQQFLLLLLRLPLRNSVMQHFRQRNHASYSARRRFKSRFGDKDYSVVLSLSKQMSI